MKRAWLLITLLGGLPLCWAPLGAMAESDAITVEDATVRVPLPGKSLTSAYFLVRNSSGEAREIVGVSSELAGRAELHNHTTEDGMMRMRQVESVAVPAGGHVRFASGGYHVMLFDLTGRPRTGDPVELTLTFADGHKESVKAYAVSVYDQPHAH